MKLRLRRGMLLIERIPEAGYASWPPVGLASGRLVKPDNTRAYFHYEAHVVLHAPGPDWRETCLTGRTIIFDKLAGKDVVLDGRSLILLPEHAALAIYKERRMNVKEFRKRINDAITDHAADQDEVDAELLDNLEAAFDGVIEDARDPDEDEDEDAGESEPTPTEG